MIDGASAASPDARRRRKPTTSVRSPRSGVSRDEGSRAATDGKVLASIANKRMTGGSGSRDEAASHADSIH